MDSIPDKKKSKSELIKEIKELRQQVAELKEAEIERTRAEEALRSSEERFRQVITSISDHIYVTEVTEDGRHLNIYLSPHAEEMTGYSLETLLSDWRFWPSTVIHPDDRAAAADQAAQLAKGQNSEVEYRLVRADGRVIWVRDRATVKREGTSRIVYGLVSDITGRKLVELEREWLTNELRDINQTLDERVRTRTAELQAVLDAAGEGIVVTDLEGVVQYINPALEQLTGYSEEEVLGQNPRLWSSGKHSKVFYAQMWQTILSGQTWRGELINKRKNGALFHALLTVTPILGPENKPQSFVGLQSDITPFKEMDRLKSEFISTAAHELRTPLTSIQGFSEILLTRDLADERKARYLTFINQQAEALAAIIEDLLDLSRLESKQGFEMVEELVNVKEIVEQVAFGFRENYPRHHYNILGPEKWPSIKGDPAKLAQLFKNLFSNATKYSPGGGEITLQVALKPQYSLLHLALSDQGVGMTREQLTQIFARFYRADASNTAIGGTGLGMTISRLIVERHGGKIWVESEYGVGTTVHVLLPLPNRADHILIIEDDEALQEVQRRSLELQGFTVVVAEDGETGLELARTCLPNLILLDLALPGMTGFTVLDRLAENDLTPSIPVIITSAMDRPEEIERAIAKGIIDYLVKPYSVSDLTVRVNRALVEARHEISVSN
jgi:PAS domain S-box-containing protein